MDWERLGVAYGMGRVRRAEPLTHGLMNPNWRLESDSGVYAVKQLRDRPPETMRANLSILPRLAERGFPVPAPCVTVDGDVLLELGGDWYAVTPWMPGSHLDGARCDPAALGGLVGRLHLALGEICPERRGREHVPEDVGEVISELDRFLVFAAEGATAFDRYARGEIEWRRRFLREMADLRPGGKEAGPFGWTHGDLQPLNLLATDGTVTAILDWDRLGVRAYGLELVRTATITFSDDRQRWMDLGRIAEFARGYRAHVGITREQIADAAGRRWWTLATATWGLERHYDQGDCGCDGIFVRASNALRWWTDHRDALVAALSGD